MMVIETRIAIEKIQCAGCGIGIVRRLPIVESQEKYCHQCKGVYF